MEPVNSIKDILFGGTLLNTRFSDSGFYALFECVRKCYELRIDHGSKEISGWREVGMNEVGRSYRPLSKEEEIVRRRVVDEAIRRYNAKH